MALLQPSQLEGAVGPADNGDKRSSVINQINNWTQKLERDPGNWRAYNSLLKWHSLGPVALPGIRHPLWIEVLKTGAAALQRHHQAAQSAYTAELRIKQERFGQALAFDQPVEAAAHLDAVATMKWEAQQPLEFGADAHLVLRYTTTPTFEEAVSHAEPLGLKLK